MSAPDTRPPEPLPSSTDWLAGEHGGLSTVAATVLAGIMMVTVVDVVGRYFLRSPLPGSSELTEVLMAVLIYAALPVVSRQGAHITVDLLSAVIPRSLLPFRDRAIAILCAATLAILAWRLWEYADQIRLSKDVTEYLKLPQAPFAYAMSVFAALAALIELWRSVRLPASAADPTSTA
jgi:TRAP-type C4-dicarboxylate transport system permease small subunit